MVRARAAMALTMMMAAAAATDASVHNASRRLAPSAARATAPVDCGRPHDALWDGVCADPARYAAYEATAPVDAAVEAPDVLAMLQRDQLSPSRNFADVAAAYGVLEDAVLDDGCSTDGNQGLYFAALFRGKIVGLQVRAAEAFAARTAGFPVATVRRAAPRQSFVTTDGGVLPFADGTFAVFSQNVLEHAPDPALYVDEALRALRPGGVFFAPPAVSKTKYS